MCPHHPRAHPHLDTHHRLLLESFVSSQKYSVQKALARRFRRFLTLKQDFNTLTLTTLQARANCDTIATSSSRMSVRTS